MNAWVRGVANWLGLVTSADLEHYDAERAEAHRRLGTLEARVDILELIAANQGRWATRRAPDDGQPG